ncbi:MAG: SHOCT domain-containing protein [Nitrososphaera sp.]
MANCTFCRKKFGFTENRYKFPAIRAEFCFDCMECSVCGSKAKGEFRGVVGWQAFCKVHYEQYSGFQQKPSSQWTEELIEARIRFLKRVIERDTQLLIEVNSKGQSKLSVIGQTAAILEGNYNAANYLKLSDMQAGAQRTTAQQQLNAEIQECQKQLGELEAMKRGEVATQESAPSSTEPDPMQILKVRYAKGEITKEQFDEMMKVLKN